MYSIVTVKSDLLHAHECQAVVITCMDFRFWEATLAGFVKTHLDVQTFDPLIAPGCTKFLLRPSNFSEWIKTFFFRFIYRNYFLLSIWLSLKLHHPSQLILVHHSACGAYGMQDAAQEAAIQKRDLLAARDILAKKFPTLSIRLFFARGQDERDIVYEEVR